MEGLCEELVAWLMLVSAAASLFQTQLEGARLLVTTAHNSLKVTELALREWVVSESPASGPSI